MNLKENKNPMHIILEEVSKVTGVSKELIKSRIRMQEAANARMLFCYMARKEGYLQREIGDFIGLGHSRVSVAYYDVKLRKEKFLPLIEKLSGSAKVLPDNKGVSENRCVLTLKACGHEWTLKPYQSSRGIRHEGKRPNVVIIDCYQEYNQKQLFEFSKYLETIACGMAFSNPMITVIENSSKDVYANVKSDGSNSLMILDELETTPCDVVERKNNKNRD